MAPLCPCVCTMCVCEHCARVRVCTRCVVCVYAHTRFHVATADLTLDAFKKCIFSLTLISGIIILTRTEKKVFHSHLSMQ